MPACRHPARHVLPVTVLTVMIGMLLYAGLVHNPAPELFPGMDKFWHTSGFAVLALSVRVAFAHGSRWHQVLLMLALGGGIELAQLFQPLATASAWDFLFDAIGIGLGLLLARLPPIRRHAEWVAAS